MHKVHFPPRSAFHASVKQRVEQYFADRNLATTGDWRLWLKTALLLASTVTAYSLLVFVPLSLPVSIGLLIVLAQGLVLVSCNAAHDGAHESFARSKTLNWLAGSLLDVAGGSQMVWRFKHNRLHHIYTNVQALDNDLQNSGMFRLSPEQPWRPWHRWQHLYAFFMYGFLTLSWVFYGDFSKLLSGRIGGYTLPKLRRAEVGFFLAARGLYFGYALLLPCLFHPVWHVLLAFGTVHFIMGLTLSVVFQLAHVIEGTQFPSPATETGLLPHSWAVHEVETTANFAPRNRWVTWYVGGLNFQIEHHLFAGICHIHYPAISTIVAQTCQEFAIPYLSYPTVWSALRGHYRFLKRLGTSESPPARPDCSVVGDTVTPVAL